MVELKDSLQKAFAELRKTEKRKFDQTVDLIVNLQKFDLKKNTINTVVNVPFKVKERKIGAFFEVKNQNVDTIVPDEFKRYANKKELKNLVNQYDAFIAQASIMPKVATTFGRALGPANKMPSPQLGILMNVDDKAILELKKKINNVVKLKSKEASLKVAVGKESMKDEELIENILAVYTALLKVLPRNKENIKNIEVKFTMTKPQKIKIE